MEAEIIAASLQRVDRAVAARGGEAPAAAAGDASERAAQLVKVGTSSRAASCSDVNAVVGSFHVLDSSRLSQAECFVCLFVCFSVGASCAVLRAICGPRNACVNDAALSPLAGRVLCRRTRRSRVCSSASERRRRCWECYPRRCGRGARPRGAQQRNLPGAGGCANETASGAGGCAPIYAAAVACAALDAAAVACAQRPLGATGACGRDGRRAPRRSFGCFLAAAGVRGVGCDPPRRCARGRGRGGDAGARIERLDGDDAAHRVSVGGAAGGRRGGGRSCGTGYWRACRRGRCGWWSGRQRGCRQRRRQRCAGRWCGRRRWRSRCRRDVASFERRCDASDRDEWRALDLCTRPTVGGRRDGRAW